MHHRPLLTLALVAGIPLSALAQPTVNMHPLGDGGPAPKWVAAQVPNPDDPRVKEYSKRMKRRVDLERELCKIRAEYFRNIRNTEIRQVGIRKLRSYTEPVIYPSLLKLFKTEGMDVRSAVLDILADQKNDEADTVLTWGAIFDEDQEFRDAAAKRLNRRIGEDGVTATDRIKSVVAEGLRGTSDELAAAAGLANKLGLVEAIPMLISAQVQGGVVGGGGGGGDTSLAWILVGTQQAFVSDLQPVVGDSAVAFDPTVSVVTEGVVLRVIDATVITYHYEVHNALVDLSSRAWGKPTGPMGFDNPRWRKWYSEDFRPDWAAKSAEDKAKVTLGGRK